MERIVTGSMKNKSREIIRNEHCSIYLLNGVKNEENRSKNLNKLELYYEEEKRLHRTTEESRYKKTQSSLSINNIESTKYMAMSISR